MKGARISYVFEIRDLPTIVSVFFTCIYLAMLFVMLFIHTGKEQRQAEETGITRKINPKLGYLDVLGFFGFILYRYDHEDQAEQGEE